jgi:hypothetical protein
MARVIATNHLQRLLSPIPGPLIRASCAWAAWLLLTVAVDFGAGGAFGVLRTDGARVGVLNDPAGLLQEFIVFPLLVAYFFWAPLALVRAIAELEVAGVIIIKEEDLGWMQNELGRRSVRLGLIVVAILFGFLLYLIYARSPLAPLLWLGEPRFALVKIPFWILHTYVAAYLVAWVLVATMLLGRLFADGRPVNVEPLHPDECGGLRPLSSYVLALVWFIGLAGAAVVLVERNYFFARGLADSPFALGIHALALVYVLASLGAFFAPLLAPHRRMGAEKRQALAEITARFQQIERDTLRQVHTGDPAQLGQAVSQLDSVRAIYRVVYEFPVWPFDTRVLRAFALAAIGQPVAAFALDAAKDQLLALVR